MHQHIALILPICIKITKFKIAFADLKIIKCLRYFQYTSQLRIYINTKMAKHTYSHYYLKLLNNNNYQGQKIKLKAILTPRHLINNIFF